MSGFDADRIFTANAPTEARTRVENAPAAVEGDLLDFILEFRVGGQFKYRCVVECTAARSLSILILNDRDALRGNLLLKHYQLEVDLRDINMYKEDLASKIQKEPAEILPLVRISNCVGRSKIMNISSLRMPPRGPRVKSCSRRYEIGRMTRQRTMRIQTI